MRPPADSPSSAVASAPADPAQAVVPTPARPGRDVVLGVAGAVAVVVALAGLFLLSVRPFASGDESAHADYAVTLVQDHRLPTLFEVVDPVFAHQSDKPQHVANHPPLYYLLIGPPLVAGLETGHPLAGYLLARAVSLLAAAGSVVLVAGVADALTRGRRPAVVVAAAALTAGYRPLVEVAGVLHNDTLSMLLGTAATWLVVLVVTRGTTRRRLVLLTVVCLLGSGVRAENAVVTAVAAAAVLVAGVLHAPQDRWGRGLRRGLAGGVLVGLVSLVGVGWFYVRSTRLYGNPLGYGVIEPQFGRAELPTAPLWLFRRADLLLTQIGLPTTDRYDGVAAWLATLPVLLVAAGAVWCVGAAVVARVRGPVAARVLPTERARWTALAAVLALHALVVVVMVVRHVDAGGGARVRYLFPLLPLVATGAAAVLLRLPGGARGQWVVVCAVAATLVTLDGTGEAAWRWWQRDRLNGPVLEGIDRGLALMGVPAASAVLVGALLLLVAGLLASAVSLRRLARASG